MKVVRSLKKNYHRGNLNQYTTLVEQMELVEGNKVFSFKKKFKFMMTLVILNSDYYMLSFILLLQSVGEILLHLYIISAILSSF